MSVVPLATVDLRDGSDVVAACRLAREAAEMLGFNDQDVAVVSTATSEVCLDAVTYGGGGRVKQAGPTSFDVYRRCSIRRTVATPVPESDPMTVRLSRRALLGASAGLLAMPAIRPAFAQGNGPIKVGVLHSLSGTMAISETALRDTVLMMVEEQNRKGGILGRKLEAVVVDPASNWPL